MKGIMQNVNDDISPSFYTLRQKCRNYHARHKPCQCRKQGAGECPFCFCYACRHKIDRHGIKTVSVLASAMEVASPANESVPYAL